MSKLESRKHYREVKNYIHNDLGFGREEIKDMIKEVIKERFEYEEAHGIVRDSIHQMVKNAVYSYLTNGRSPASESPYNKAREMFNNIVREEISKNFDIKIEISKKEDGTNTTTSKS